MSYATLVVSFAGVLLLSACQVGLGPSAPFANIIRDAPSLSPAVPAAGLPAQPTQSMAGPLPSPMLNEAGGDEEASRPEDGRVDVQAPLISWATDCEDASFLVGTRLTFELQVSSAIRPAEIRFVSDDRELGRKRGWPYIWEWNTESAGYGNYSIIAIAYDAQENELGRTPLAQSFSLARNPNPASQRTNGRNAGNSSANLDTQERNDLDLIID